MGSYGELRSKWRGLLEQGAGGCDFDLELLPPPKFCVLYSDAGGESMACYSEIQVTGFFDDARDFSAFLRFAEMPRILDHDAGINREPFPDVADAYLRQYQGEERENIDHLIGMIDRSLNTEMISASELSLICSKFNEAFSSTNPEVQILAWGSLADVLTSSALAEALEEAGDEEVDEDEQPVTALRNLLDAGEFREDHEEHLALARRFLEGCINVC